MNDLTQLRRDWENRAQVSPGSLPSTPLQHGFLLLEMIDNDDEAWGRWDYWAKTKINGGLLSRPIPQLHFASSLAVRKNLEHCLDAIPTHGGGWQGWGGSEYFDYFLDWLLYGLGHSGQPTLPREPSGCQGASDRLLRLFDLRGLQLFPDDYLGDLLCSNRWGRSTGFFPTHLNICQFMTFTSFEGLGSAQTASMIDPCCGTGRMLLTASNHTLVCYGMELSGTIAKAALVNMALYAPWAYRPIPFLDSIREQPQDVVAEMMMQAASSNPQSAAHYKNTVPESENQWRYEPIKVRRKKGILPADATQGCLF